MVNFFLRIYDFLHARRRLCMILMSVLTVILIVMMSTLKYNENIYDFLPMSGNNKKAITLYQDISGGQRIIIAFKMKGDDSINTDRLIEAVDTFAEKVNTPEGHKYIQELTTQVDFEKYSGITDFIYHNIPVMLTDSDYNRMEKLLAKPDYIDKQLSNDVRMIMMPATGYFSSNISNDPLGLFSPVIDRLQSRQSSMPLEIDNGYIFSSGKKYALAMFVSPYGGMESAKNAQLVSYVDSITEATMKVLPDVEVAATGSPVIAVGNASQIKSDSQWAISISVTLILLLLVFSFRKVKNLMLVCVAILFGWLFAMGFIAVLRSDVSLIVLGIGSIIIGIAVNYPLHFIAHTDHGGTTREILKEMVAPLLIGNITTVGAFASLIPLNSPALRDLGLFAAFMLIGTILFVLVFLPHLVRQREKMGEEHLSFGKISSMTPERHRWVLYAILLLTPIFGYFSLNTSFDANMHHINYMTNEQEHLLSGLNVSAGLNDTSNVYIVTEGKTWDEALRKRAEITPALEKTIKEHQANSYTDVTDYICSQAEQQRRIDRWNSFWTKHSSEVQQLLHQKAPQYGFSNDAFDGFYTIIDKTYTAHPFEYFEPVRSVLFANSFSTSNGNCSVVDIIDAKGKDKAALENTLNHQPSTNTQHPSTYSQHPSTYSFDFVGMNSAVANSLSNDFNYIGIACAFIVFIFLWLSFGRLELSLLAFLPMALGWIWILGIMDILNIQFNIVNVILATFIFGQGDDYTIFMTDGLIEEYAYKKKILPSFKNSIIISALIMFIGMGALIIAKHPALHSLAEVTIVGMFTVVMMAWIVPPMVFSWLVKSNDNIRHTPLTLYSLVTTLLATVFYIVELTFGCIFALMLKVLPLKQSRREDILHNLICRTLHWDMANFTWVKMVTRNAKNETFKRGSLLICNHQSILDPLYILTLSPKIIIALSGKNRKIPFVHTLFRLANFINLDQPFETLKKEIALAVDKGYSVVVFPEGKRTDGHIAQFHTTLFQLATEIGCDILPVFLHGTGDIMPKGSTFPSRGQVDIEIGQRIPATQLKEYGEDSKLMAHNFQQMFIDYYQDMRRRIENTHYFHHYIIGKYTYKGITVERETKRLLKRYNDFSQWIDGYSPINGSLTTLNGSVRGGTAATLIQPQAINILNAGKGQFALLFALVHPELSVNAYISDQDDFTLASCCEPLPQNLHFLHTDQNREFDSSDKKNIIDIKKIIL